MLKEGLRVRVCWVSRAWMTREGGHRKVAAINQNFEGIGLKLGVLQMHEKWNLEVWFHDLGNAIQGSRLTCCWIA